MGCWSAQGNATRERRKTVKNASSSRAAGVFGLRRGWCGAVWATGALVWARWGQPAGSGLSPACPHGRLRHARVVDTESAGTALASTRPAVPTAPRLRGKSGVAAQRLAGQCEAMGVVQQPIEDGIGERRLADELVPVLHRQLAGDERGARPWRSSISSMRSLRWAALSLCSPQSSRITRSVRAARPSAGSSCRRHGRCAAAPTAAAGADSAPSAPGGRPGYRARRPARSCRSRWGR